MSGTRQALNLMELRFVKAYASPSQLTPRSQASDSVVDVSDMETATLRRAVTRLVSELKQKQDSLNAKGLFAAPGPLSLHQVRVSGVRTRRL